LDEWIKEGRARKVKKKGRSRKEGQGRKEGKFNGWMEGS
jgi:hypothetical protein